MSVAARLAIMLTVMAVLFVAGWSWGFVLGIGHHQRLCVIVGVAEYKADERGFPKFEWKNP